MSEWIKRMCYKCNKEYMQKRFDQTPGFRECEEDICPYCKNVNRQSHEFEFWNITKEEYER